MFHSACAGKDVWKKTPWWLKCLFLNLMQMCPNCWDLSWDTEITKLPVNKKQGKLQASRQHKKYQTVKPQSKEVGLVQPCPGKGSKMCGARHPGRVWAGSSGTHGDSEMVTAAAWIVSFLLAMLPRMSDSTLQYRNSPHFPGLWHRQRGQKNHNYVSVPKNLLPEASACCVFAWRKPLRKT